MRLIIFLMLSVSLFAQTPKKLTREQVLELEVNANKERPIVDAINKLAELALTPIRQERAGIQAAICKSAGIAAASCIINEQEGTVSKKEEPPAPAPKQ